VLRPIGLVTLEQELLDRALQLLTQRERATIQEHILSTADDIDSALQKAFDAAQEKQNLCEKKMDPQF
jgi:transcription elongation GreA/GreB family factor